MFCGNLNDFKMFIVCSDQKEWHWNIQWRSFCDGAVTGELLTLRTSHRKFAETNFSVKYLDGREHSKQISHQNTRKTLRGSYLLTRMKDSDWILSKCNTGIQIWAKNFGLSLKTMVGSCNLLGFLLEHLSPGECCDFLEHLDPDAHCEGLFLEVLG